jgi:hypothetical protein
MAFLTNIGLSLKGWKLSAMFAGKVKEPTLEEGNTHIQVGSGLTRKH